MNRALILIVLLLALTLISPFISWYFEPDKPLVRVNPVGPPTGKNILMVNALFLPNGSALIHQHLEVEAEGMRNLEIPLVCLKKYLPLFPLLVSGETTVQVKVKDLTIIVESERGRTVSTYREYSLPDVVIPVPSQSLKVDLSYRAEGLRVRYELIDIEVNPLVLRMPNCTDELTLWSKITVARQRGMILSPLFAASALTIRGRTVRMAPLTSLMGLCSGVLVENVKPHEQVDHTIIYSSIPLLAYQSTWFFAASISGTLLAIIFFLIIYFTGPHRRIKLREWISLLKYSVISMFFTIVVGAWIIRDLQKTIFIVQPLILTGSLLSFASTVISPLVLLSSFTVLVIIGWLPVAGANLLYYRWKRRELILTIEEFSLLLRFSPEVLLASTSYYISTTLLMDLIAYSLAYHGLYIHILLPALTLWPLNLIGALLVVYRVLGTYEALYDDLQYRIRSAHLLPGLGDFFVRIPVHSVWVDLEDILRQWGSSAIPILKVMERRGYIEVKNGKVRLKKPLKMYYVRLELDEEALEERKKLEKLKGEIPSLFGESGG